MCLAVPMKVISINGNEAEVGSSGTTYKASILLVPEVKVGDYILMHTGYEISIVDSDEAQETLKIYQELEKISDNE